MHVVLILFTMREVSAGGFGFSEQDNGWLFTFVGVVGIITQGKLIGPLTDRFGSSALMAAGFIICGIGLTAIPYVPPHYGLLGLLPAMGLVAIGNGLVTPSNMALLTHVSGPQERGAVMGVSESVRALSSFSGVLIGGIIWDATINKDGFFDYHTTFLLCGLFTVLAWLGFRFSNAWKVEDEILANAEADE